MKANFAVTAIAQITVVGCFFFAVPASAQGIVDEYCTRISKHDKVASDGYRLTDAGSILRQDRANFHKFGTADDEDQSDNTFASTTARARIPAMLDNGQSYPNALHRIVTGTPFICVEIYPQYIYVYEN